MLRSAGVEARLVCSLPTLPFQPAQKIELSELKHNATKQSSIIRKNTPDLESEPDAESDGSLRVRSVRSELSLSNLPNRSKGESLHAVLRCKSLRL